MSEPVLDGQPGDPALLVVDAVDHPVIAAAGTVQLAEAELHRLADRVVGHRSVQELA